MAGFVEEGGVVLAASKLGRGPDPLETFVPDQVVAVHRRSWLFALKTMRFGIAGAWLAILCLAVLPSWAQEKTDRLTDLSLEDLMNTKVTSVSKAEQKISRVAAAIYVITQESIRRSGATNIPDLLRMVPGLDVAQINSNTWAISARGFNGRFSNKMLVMVDGRSVYTQTFAGVFWDVLDLPLENIDRIEVIRGPGGSVWGANAVNGVISIVTRKASATRGGLLVASAGNVDLGSGMTQYGGGLGDQTDYRIYAKYLNNDHLPGLGSQDGSDSWHVLRAGFRTDSTLSPRDILTFEGNMYTGREGVSGGILPSITSPVTVITDRRASLSGGVLQSVWEHAYSEHSDSKLQVSFDNYDRSDPLHELRSRLDVDFEHHVAAGQRQDFVWGLSYRYSLSTTDGGLTVLLNPANLSTQLFGSFIQDEIAIVPERLYLTLGTKLEHNDYTGLNFMPSVRLAWTPSERRTFWAAVSHAVRTPSETDIDARANLGGGLVPGGIPAVAALVGNPRVGNELLTAYEGGYRSMLSDALSIDLAAFYDHYDKLRTVEPAAPFFEGSPSPPHLVVPVTFQNFMYGEGHGLEISANWKVNERWTLSPEYAFQQIHMHLTRASQDTASQADAEGSTPVHSAQLRSHVKLSRDLAWDASAGFVDRLRSLDVPAYTRLDTGLSWQWTESLSSSFVGQNLLKDRRLEFTDSTGVPAVLDGEAQRIHKDNLAILKRVRINAATMRTLRDFLRAVFRHSSRTTQANARAGDHRFCNGHGGAGPVGDRVRSEGGVPF